jgi:hypothetical protein
VHDQEYEIDNDFRTLIKDKNSEEKVRQIFAKAYGLEPVQKARDEWKNKYEGINKNFSEIKDDYGMYARGKEMYQKGDVIGAARYFFTPDDLYKIAIDVAKYHELDPETRARVDNEYKEKYRATELEEKNKSYETKANESERRAVNAQIDYELTRPDVAELAAKVDDLYGKKGYFRDKIAEFGHVNWLQGRQLSPQECIKAVLDDYKPIVSKIATLPTAKSVTENITTPSGANAAPNLKGSGSAGRQAKAKTLADLTKIREALDKQLEDKE